jgi:hypothetical protein
MEQEQLMAEAKVSIAKPMRGMTLRVVATGARRARFRLWLGVRIMQLAAKVWGTDDIEIVVMPAGTERAREEAALRAVLG